MDNVELLALQPALTGTATESQLQWQRVGATMLRDFSEDTVVAAIPSLPGEMPNEA
jgi:hypothetical protein